ncbi:MAG: MMPL family transporter [Thaumarchaeota archaeon]|nr:MMPL family transporter [Nitrososphaerota archaeon]
MSLEGSRSPRSAPFRRLGGFVYRRRRLVIAAWIIALVALVPIISQAGSSTSLQQGSSAGNQLESVRAQDLIAAEFSRTVPNSSLLVVISAGNVSSESTQTLVRDMVSSLRTDSRITGLNQTVDVFSRLYSAIEGANDGGYATLRGANSTAHLLLGVPSLYLSIWEQAFANTNDITASNSLAYNGTYAALSAANATAFRLYSSRLLGFFNSSWSDSWVDQRTASLNFSERSTVSAHEADVEYLGDSTSASASFGRDVVGFFTLDEFISKNGSIPPPELTDFAVGFLSNNTSFTPTFVRNAMGLGVDFSNSTRDELAGNIVRDPGKFGADPGLSTLVSSFVSPSGDTTLVSLGFDRSSTANMLEVRSVVQDSLTRNGQSSGNLSAEVTGQDAINYDFGESTRADLDLILPVTIVLLIVATGLFFRSILTPFITLGTIGVALGIAQVFIVVVSSYIAKVDFTIPTVLLTVLIGVGTDYSVFVLARYREERVRGLSVQEAVEISVTWAGESITTSGATVIISFLALGLTSIVFLKTMGLVVGLGVGVALLVALTMVPAIIGVVGGRAFWPYSGQRFARYASGVLTKLEAKRGYFSRTGIFAVKNAKALIVVAALVSAPALYVYSTTTPTYDFLSAAPASLESVSVSDHLTSAFGGGRLFPTYVVLTFESPVVIGHSFNDSEMATIGAMSSYLAGHPDIRNVTGPARPFGSPIDLSADFSDPRQARTFSAMLQGIGKDNRTALLTVNFGIDPYSTRAISDAQEIRNYLHGTYDNRGSASGSFVGLLVGGASGSILDTKNVFDSQFDSVVPLVAVGVALVLLVVLGSLFLPVFAVLSVLMSIVWTLAATKLVFQAYFDYQILFITPFFLFVTLLGLGMDYNVFILTRVREEATKGGRLDEAIVRAIEQTGGIITAAAVILAGSLGALMLSSDLLLKQMGFAFAFSILIDALVVRTYLVPAVMSTMGRWNWFSPIPYLNRSHSLFKKDAEEAP